MNLVKIGFTNLNTTVGALRSNTDKVIARMNEFAKMRCAFGCFAEQVISGYPAEDLVLWEGFVERQWKELDRIREATAKLDCPTAFVVGLTIRHRGENYNAAAVLQKGRILGIVPKEKLPTYNVFYEKRVYASGRAGWVKDYRGVPFGDLIFRFPFATLALEVCEDLWEDDGPMRRRAYSGAEIVVNISASPWRTGMVEARAPRAFARA
jgi:NAD+ synthase (glutamine-hydrolysing)